MEIHELVDRAFKRDLSDVSALNDAFDSLRMLEETDKEEAHRRQQRSPPPVSQVRAKSGRT